VRHLAPHALWLGHADDARNLRAVLERGITAIVDLAVNEPPIGVTREIVYCRFPLVDGAGNPPWLLRSAVETTAALIRSGVPTLVACGLGMSRSPAVAAMAVALVTGRPAEECLADVLRSAPADVSPGLWREVVAVPAKADDA
jgi:protein-tyrosine phosphatase